MAKTPERIVQHVTPAGKSIFEDLPQNDKERSYSLKIRAGLMNELIAFIEQNNFTQMQAAERMGVQQGRISLLLNGKISKFTIDALADMQDRAGIASQSRYLHLDQE